LDLIIWDGSRIENRINHSRDIDPIERKKIRANENNKEKNSTARINSTIQHVLSNTKIWLVESKLVVAQQFQF
jgi:hypothetical protein